MSDFASLIFNDQKFIIKEKVNNALSDSSFQAVQRINIKNKATIFFFKDAFRDITRQKLFFDEIEYLKSINMDVLIISIKGFSVGFKHPNEEIYYPAIAYDSFPSMSYTDLQNKLYVLNPTQKSIIAFGTLVALEHIFSKNLPYRFQPDYLFLSNSKEPSLFYTTLNHKNSQNPYYYWNSLEMFLGAESDESTNVFSFSMFLFELLGDNHDFFSQTKSEVKHFLKNMVIFDTTDKGGIGCIIKLCMTNNHLIRPKFSFLLKKFIKERICFPGTDETLFDAYKYKIYNSLQRKIPKEFYAEHILYCRAMKGDLISKIYLLKYLSEKNRFDEFVSLAISLIKSKNNEPIELYMKFFLRHLTEFQTKRIFIKIPINMVENNPKLYQLYNMFQYSQGMINFGISSMFSFDPTMQIEYASDISNNRAIEIRELSYHLISEAIMNPKLKILSNHWQMCKDKLKYMHKHASSYSITDKTNDKSLKQLICSTIVDHRLNSTLTAKNGNALALFYKGAIMMDNFNTVDTISIFKMCAKNWPICTSYMMALVYFRSAVYESGISFLMAVITSRSKLYRQIAAETLAEIAIDGIGMPNNTELGLTLLSYAPKMTERKKFILAYLKLYKNTPTMTEKEAEEHIENSVYGYTVLFRFCRIFLMGLFPMMEKESEKEYKLRMCEKQPPFALACRYFCGYFASRNPFQAQKLFYTAKQIKTAQNSNDTKILNYYTAAHKILRYEDYREKCPRKFIDPMNLANPKKCD